MAAAVPVVERAHYAYSPRRGCPDSEEDSLHSPYIHHMGAELFIGMVKGALVVEVKIFFGDDREKAIRIMKNLLIPLTVQRLQLVSKNAIPVQEYALVKSILVDLLHGIFLVIFGINNKG